ncbi:MAG: HAMP domain-containing histidine kinase, partial [Solirubrobacterales bacterium]|nr:HAMP domain-containing histidine kinase [Solirubrobacterales bacterium]
MPGGRATSGRTTQTLRGITLAAISRMRGMTLRKRISLAAAAAVAVAVAVAVVVCYGAVRYRLQSELRTQLTLQAQAINHGYTHQRIPGLPASAGGPAPYEQVVLANGQSVSQSGVPIPNTSRAAAVATGESGPYFSQVNIRGTPVRVYTFMLNSPDATYEGMHMAVQLGRPLTQTNSVLSELRLVLLVVFLLGVPLAAIFGRLAARRVLSPLAKVSTTAQLIAETDDLSRRIDVHQEDEVGQLAARFNAMLARLAASREALDESVQSQRQLVADASHELRTPVTSLRTNAEVLLASPSLDPEDRRLLEDVLEQSEELSALVADLIDVARGELRSDALDEVRLDRLVEDALARARRNYSEVEFRAQLDAIVVPASPEHLSRAVNNLLDNAAKHAGDGPVDVRVDSDGVTVRDHGSGIDPKDLPHVFDRFYRGVNSRASQGSGLGLAIVKQTAEQHGGSVRAENAPGGGASFTLTLAGAEPTDE